jgi:outer membrane protein TolC
MVLKKQLTACLLVVLAFLSPFAAWPQLPPVQGEILSQDRAVALALQHSPALQALVADSQASQDRALAGARPGLLRFSLARLKQGDEREIDRSLSLSLLELLTWPWRARAADAQIGVLQQQQALAVLSHAQAVRAQWVNAVAAQQREHYLNEVRLAAQMGATLAQRLQASGQFSAAQAAQQALVLAEAEQTLNQAQQQAVAEKEALIRLTGLSADHTQTWTLPERLPELPATLGWQADQVSATAAQERLDVRLAQARWQALGRSKTDETLHSLVDLEAGWQRQSTTGQPAKQGPEFSLALLSADLGAARRRAASAEEQAALAQWQQSTLVAQSQVRERWAAYEASYRLATHAREVLEPIRKRLLGERLKQYNGMLIGPLDLLDEARSHSASVIVAMQAQRDFWLSDIALRSAMDGSDAPRAAP